MSNQMNIINYQSFNNLIMNRLRQSNKIYNSLFVIYLESKVYISDTKDNMEFYQITVKWKYQSYKLVIPQIIKKEQLQRLIQTSLKFKDQIIGIVNSHGKYYDWQIFIENLYIFRNKTIELITRQQINEKDKQKSEQLKEQENAKIFYQNINFDQNDLNIDPISFATNYLPNEFQTDFSPFNDDTALQDQAMQLPFLKPSQIIGQVYNINNFQSLILDQDLAIVIISDKKPLIHLNFQYYFMKNYHYNHKEKNKILIYQNKKKICQVPLHHTQWKEIEKIVERIIVSIAVPKVIISRAIQTGTQCKKPSSQKQKMESRPNCMFKGKRQNRNNFDSEPEQKQKKINRNSHMNQGQVRKTFTHQQKNPFSKKLQQQRPPNRHGSPKRQKNAVAKQYNKKSNNGQRGIYSNQEQSISSDELLFQRAQETYIHQNIPIIIRKSNNKIEKINASYPLSLQQNQALNSLLQIQVQGILTEEQINKIKMMILGQNSKILELFWQYNGQDGNVSALELCKMIKKAMKLKRKTTPHS